MKLQLRKSIDIFRNDNFMHFILTNEGLRKTYEISDEIEYLLELLDGNHEDHEVRTKFKTKYPDFADDVFDAILKQMIKDNLLEENLSNIYTDDYYERYKRQISFFEKFSNESQNKYELQNKLRRSKVAIFGIGGTGSWIVQSLVLAGVGNFKLFDFDVVELSNLNRQVLYEFEDIGTPKLEAMSKKMKKINPDVNIETITLKVEESSISGSLIKDCDLVINCTDFPSVFRTSMWIAEQCMKLKIPHIVGGGYHSNISVIGPTIIPYKTACWKCYELSVAESNNRGILIKEKSKEHFGSIGVISAITSNLQAWDAIRVLIGENPINSNKKGYFNFQNYTIEWDKFEKNELCPLCSRED